METKPKLRLPVWSLVLDAVGALFIGFGIFGLASGDELALPAFLDAQALSVVMIFAGVLLTLPMIILIIKQATR